MQDVKPNARWNPDDDGVKANYAKFADVLAEIRRLRSDAKWRMVESIFPQGEAAVSLLDEIRAREKGRSSGTRITKIGIRMDCRSFLSMPH